LNFSIKASFSTPMFPLGSFHAPSWWMQIPSWFNSKEIHHGWRWCVWMIDSFQVEHWILPWKYFLWLWHLPLNVITSSHFKNNQSCYYF
jgi:hypothetical protein